MMMMLARSYNNFCSSLKKASLSYHCLHFVFLLQVLGLFLRCVQLLSGVSQVSQQALDL
jgi:hypothetical protein